MCMVSAIGDNYRDNWINVHPSWPPMQQFPHIVQQFPHIVEVSRAEFDLLKREVEELKKLLDAAKKFDEATGQPNCETEEKFELIRKIAKMVGVELNV